MNFRNITAFCFPASTDLSDVESMLSGHKLKPVGPLEVSSRGFVSPLGQHSEEMTRKCGSAIWVTVGVEDKILPGAVVKDLLQKKLAEIEEKEGRKPSGRTRKRIKDELVTELLPRAFVRPSRIDALIDTSLGVVAVDASGRKNAEGVVAELRHALGSFPALPLNAEVAPRAVLTGWIAGDPLPDGFALGEECELRDPADNAVVVKVKNMELQSAEVEKHIEAGKQCTRLALCFDDRVSFVIGEDLVIRRFKLLDAAVEEIESEDHDDIVAEMDARFALNAGEFKRLFAALRTVFSFSTPEG